MYYIKCVIKDNSSLVLFHYLLNMSKVYRTKFYEVHIILGILVIIFSDCLYLLSHHD